MAWLGDGPSLDSGIKTADELEELIAIGDGSSKTSSDEYSEESSDESSEESSDESSEAQ